MKMGDRGLHIEGTSIMFCTTLSYVALRLLGEEELLDSPARRRGGDSIVGEDVVVGVGCLRVEGKQSGPPRSMVAIVHPQSDAPGTTVVPHPDGVPSDLVLVRHPICGAHHSYSDVVEERALHRRVSH